MGKGRRPITQDLYELLTGGFRERPGVYIHAATVASCGWVMAKRGWLDGWPPKGFDPIRDVIARERTAASEDGKKIERDLRIKEAEDVAQARRDAILGLAEEGKMVKVVRANIIGLQVLTNQMLPVMQNLVKQTKDELTELAATGKSVPLGMRLKLFKTFAEINKMGTDAAHKVVEVERKRVGEPETIIGIKDVEEMTLERGQSIVETAQRALNRAAKRRVDVLEAPTNSDGEPVH